MRKLLLLTVAVMLVIGLLGSGIYSFFRDTETSSGNTVEAGSLDLKLSHTAGSDEYWFDEVTETWTASGVLPGDKNIWPGNRVVNLKNSGTCAADHLGITCDYSIVNGTVESGGENTADEMAEFMIITKLEYTDTGWTLDLVNGVVYLDDGYDVPPPNKPGDWVIEDLNGDGVKTLNELAHGGGIDNLPPVPHNGFHTIQMNLEFSDQADNRFQGDRLIINVHFALNQHESQ